MSNGREATGVASRCRVEVRLYTRMAVPTEMSTLLEWQPQLPSSRNSTTSIPPEETPMKMVEERKADRCANVVIEEVGFLTNVEGRSLTTQIGQ